ncbi:MAG: SDR family oxidoreductase [Anaerolineae bacterium]|nr:SDR family oxidoreductase [Anaerolineae bacterium]
MASTGKLVDCQICMVTGATDGIGKATAHALAAQRMMVVLVGRNPQKGAATVEHIAADTGNPNVDFLLADLSSQADIRALAAAFVEKYQRLDVLINNAGGLFAARRESVDGIEMTFALNHLSYFLLTNLLLDTIIAGAPARIINVSSGMHSGAVLDFNDLENKKDYSAWRAYGESKLANILFTYELARRLKGTGVTANALHPGVVATHFGADSGYRARGISPEEGAQTGIYLATAAAVEEVTGRYFVNCKPVPSSKVSYNGADAKRLWEISARMTGLEATI